mgnify:CR=1 FL=1
MLYKIHRCFTMFKTRYTYKGEAVMGFSEKLNELRLEAGLSQKELTELSKYSAKQVVDTMLAQ